MLREDKEAWLERKTDLTPPTQKKSFENTLPSLHNYLDNEASVVVSQICTQSTETPLDKPADKVVVLKNETKLYSDKHDTKIKLPEVIVCFNDGGCHVVKDICIDEGLQPLERILLQDNEISEKISVFRSSVTNANVDMHKGMDDNAADITKDFKLISVVDKEDIKDGKHSWSLSEIEEKPSKAEKPRSNISEQKISLEKLLSMEQFDSNSHDINPASYDFSNDHKHWIDQENVNKNEVHSTTVLPISAIESIKSNGVKHNPHDDPGEGCSTTTHVKSDVKVSGKSSVTEESSANSMMESGVDDTGYSSGPVTNFDSDKNITNKESQPFLQAQNVAEEAAPVGPTSSTQSSFYHPNHGDPNFSGPSYLSGPKASSGHIAFSGSISFRSDSSTTSTRSFAFPILQSEWNTSPVKMAKADRRHLRKHRCWSMGFLCCKF